MDFHNVDCYEFMDTMDSESVDLCLTDPPYGRTSCSFDRNVNIAIWAKKLWRLMKPDGVIVINSMMPFTIDLFRCIPFWKYEWIWEKSNATGHLQCKSRPLKAHETLQVFSKTKGRYFPQMELGTPYVWNSMRTASEHFDSPKNDIIVNKGERYPRSVLRFKQERGLHPTQKPLALGQYMVKTYSKEGDTVFDPFAGSGTYLLAAQTLGRQAIGCERNSFYYKKAKDRIDAHLYPNV